MDSPALVELACLHRSDCRDAAELFCTALRELDLIDGIEVQWPAREAEVLLRGARHHAARLLEADDDVLARSGHIAALLHQLGSTTKAVDPGLAELADDLEVLNLYWEDGFDNPESIAVHIRRACRTLLDGPPFAPVFPRSGDRPAVIGSVSVVRERPRRFWQQLSLHGWWAIQSRWVTPEPEHARVPEGVRAHRDRELPLGPVVLLGVQRAPVSGQVR
ncbi:hypothetical protein AB0I30_10505 [Nocardia tengchongensis]|uniref:hypothetical protein n=1 Tax=Nocardia tengchongensis TaxID=2055889 RepID=UPI0033EC1F3F